MHDASPCAARRSGSFCSRLSGSRRTPGLAPWRRRGRRPRAWLPGRPRARRSRSERNPPGPVEPLSSKRTWWGSSRFQPLNSKALSISTLENASFELRGICRIEDAINRTGCRLQDCRRECTPRPAFATVRVIQRPPLFLPPPVHGGTGTPWATAVHRSRLRIGRRVSWTPCMVVPW